MSWMGPFDGHLPWHTGGTVRRQAGPEPAATLDAAAAAPAARTGAAGRQTPVLKAKQAQQETVTMGDYLVKSLTAHSLDLPPQAAKVCA